MRHSRFEQRGFPMGHSLARSALVELKQRFSSMGFGRLAWSREDHLESRTYAGWWFGTWPLWLSIHWEVHHPNWRTHILQRGWNHHPVWVTQCWCTYVTMTKDIFKVGHSFSTKITQMASHQRGASSAVVPWAFPAVLWRFPSRWMVAMNTSQLNVKNQTRQLDEGKTLRKKPHISIWYHFYYIHSYGSLSKPCTPGEHQNSW